MQLRPYQVEAKGKVNTVWASGRKNVCLRMPTGAGKTPTFSELLAESPGVGVAIAHRSELVSQMSLALARYEVRHRIVGPESLRRDCAKIHMAELGTSYYDPNARCVAAGVDTLVRVSPSEPWLQQVRRWVVDEGHHLLADNKWGKAAAMFHADAQGLAVTATVNRPDGKGLGRHADGLIDELVHGPEMRDLFNWGYLTPYRIFAPTSDIDLSTVPVTASGDFSPEPLRNAVHKSHIVGDVVQHYLRIAPGKLGITFAVDLESSAEIAAAFRDTGVPAEVISGNTPALLRVQLMRQFRQRKILQLVTVDILGEGVDVPAVEVVSMARPTESFIIFAQQFGRMLRLMIDPEIARYWHLYTNEQRRAYIAASNKPHGILIDHVGNTLRHGLPDAPRHWTLDRRDGRKGKRQDDDVIPMRRCPECIQPYERVYRCCPFCGFYPEPTGRTAPAMVDGDLAELDSATLAAMRGDILKVDSAPVLLPHLSAAANGAYQRRHWERQQSQQALRDAIALYGGWQAHQGRSESEGQRRFWHAFGIDVATAQTLGATESDNLRERIQAVLTRASITPILDAS